MLQIGLLVPRFWLYLDSVQILWCYVTNYYTVWTLLRPFIVWYSSLFFHSFFFFWTDDSFLTWYYTCFNPILPNHPSLSLSHRVQKTVLYICIFFFFEFCFAFYFFLLFFIFLILKSLMLTCVPKHEPPSHLPPQNISLGHPHAPAPSMLHPASDIDWR